MSKVAVARDMGIGAIVRVWTQATAFVVILEAGRTLELNEFGVYAMASVFLIVLNTLIYSGIYEYLLKTDDFRAVADTCFCINLAIAACGSLIIVALAPLIAALAAAPSVEPMMFWLAPTALVGAVTSWQEAILLRRKTVTAYYVIWFCSETISAALALTLLLHGMHLYALVGYRYSQCICNFVAYLLYTRDFPRLAWQAEQARTALFFALPLYGSRLVGIVANYSADLIIGILASPAAAGSYGWASRMIFGFSEVWFQPIKTIAWVRFTAAARRGIGLRTGMARIDGRSVDARLADAGWRRHIIRTIDRRGARPSLACRGGGGGHPRDPSLESEKEILRNFADSEPLAKIEPVMNADEVLEVQQAVRRVAVDEELMNYTLAIVEKTRQHEYLSLGVSPRGSMSLYRAAQAMAVMEGRNYCIPDDFKRLVIPVFSHRCIVSSRYLSTMKKSDQSDSILREIVESTPSRCGDQSAVGSEFAQAPGEWAVRRWESQKSKPRLLRFAF